MGVFMENEDDSPYPPTQAIPPSQFNIDPSTTRWAPTEYAGMLAQGAANWMSEDVIPAIESVGNYWHQKMLPGGEQVEPQADPLEQFNKPAKESEPLLRAIDTGYADKKLMKPIDEIRKAIQEGDYEALGKVHRKLSDALTGGMSWGEKYVDNYFRQGRQATAGKMAADVIMNEIMRGQYKAQEATNAGLIQPSELLPEQRIPTPVYEHLVPPATFETGLGPDFGIDPDPLSSIQPSMVPAQPGQVPAAMVPGDVDPAATLLPLQEDLVSARVKSYAHPRQPRADKATNQWDIVERGIKNEKMGMSQKLGRPLTPEEESAIEYKWTGGTRKDEDLERKKGDSEALRKQREAHTERYKSLSDKDRKEIDLMGFKEDEIEARTRFLDAQTEYKKKEPALQRELQGMKGANHPQHFVYQAIARVKAAIEKGEQPNEVDAALFKSYLNKGNPEFGTTFLGELYNRYTGKMVEPEKPKSGKGVVDTLKEYLGKLLGSDATEEMEKLDELVPDMPTPKTPEEAAKLKPGTRYKTPDGKVMVR